MARGKAKDAGTKQAGPKNAGPVRGALAWAAMRRDPEYRAAWAAWAAEAGPARFEPAPFPLRIQTEADLGAAPRWPLLAWADPAARPAPFWDGVPMLVAEPDPDPRPGGTPLLTLLDRAGACVEGLRLLGGRLVLKAELRGAALQILVPSGRAFAPRDGIMAKLDLDLPLETPLGRMRHLWRVAGRTPPPRTRPAPHARTPPS